MDLKKFLNDPFVNDKLNPLFIQEAKKHSNPGWLFFAFRKLLQPLYLNYVTKRKGSVYFLSTISSDGMGDFIALQKCAELFRKSTPDFKVKIAYTVQRILPEWPTNLETYIFYDREYLIEQIVEGKELPDYKSELKSLENDIANNLKNYEEIKAKSPFAAQAIEEYHEELQNKAKMLKTNDGLKQLGMQFYQELIEARAIVNISLALNTFENPLLSGKSIYFSETGNFQGIQYAEKLNWYSMGLLPVEEGIFLKKHPMELEKKAFYLSYITTISNAKLCYIYLICNLQKIEAKDIEIILLPLKEEELDRLDLAYLGSLGISQIAVDESTKKISEHPGKTLFLKQLLPIDYHKFIELMVQSQNPVGCTGDLSLSEAISHNKHPFYEMREHKTETIDALIGIASFLQLRSVNNYLMQLKEIEESNPIQNAINLAKILQSSSFLLEWQKLENFLKKYYCFEDSFLATLNAFFAYQDNSAWKMQEQEILLSSTSVEEAYLEAAKKIAS